MSEDGRFGGAGETPDASLPATRDYGFFAPAPTGAPSQFGGPPARAAAAAPPAAPPATGATYPPAPPAGATYPLPPPIGAPYQAPGYGQPAYPPVKRDGLPAWAIVAICVPVGLVVVGVLAAIAIPVFLSQRSTPLMPPSMGGVSTSTDAVMIRTVDGVHAQLTKQNPGAKVDVAGYGNLASGYLLMGLSSRVDAARELGDFGVTGAPTSFGDVQCGTNSDHASLCLHTGMRGTVEVAQFGPSAGDLARLAEVTDAAWAAQPFGD